MFMGIVSRHIKVHFENIKVHINWNWMDFSAQIFQTGLGLPQKVWQTSTEFYKVETELVWADLHLIQMTWSLSFDLNSKKQDRSEHLGIKFDWNSMTVYLWELSIRKRVNIILEGSPIVKHWDRGPPEITYQFSLFHAGCRYLNYAHIRIDK